MDRTNFCTDNYAKAESETGEKDEDWAKICLETRVLGAVEQPEAGAGLIYGALAGLGLTGLGAFLKRKEIYDIKVSRFYNSH